MSNIKTTAYTPSTINELKFRIPLYQRPYAWGESQINQLLNDLYNQFLKNPEKEYYIGILSIGKTENNSNLFDLIDGQQRITTLNLIGLAFKENNLNNKDDWDKFLEERLDLYGRLEDMKYLKTLDASSNPNATMIDAIKTITSFLRTKEEYKIEEFSKYVYTKATFFLSKVPEDYTVIDKNLQFVRMNNRGKQLESTDILKTKLASIITDKNDQKVFLKKWNEISQLGCNDIEIDDQIVTETEKPKLEDILNHSFKTDKTIKKENEIFYESIVSFSEFLLIALSRFKTNDVKVSFNKEKLLEEFGFGEEKSEWNEKSVNDFMALLYKQYDLFNKFIIKRDKESKYKFKNIRGENDDKIILNQNLLMFQSYLYVSREAHSWMIDAFNWLEENENQIQENENQILKKLKEIDDKFPNTSDLDYDSINRYWFWRLDYYLWESRAKLFENNKKVLEVANKFVFRANRSIEHVAPQTRKSGENYNITSEFLHKFGNLAMISSEHNSSLQNAPFEMKRTHVKLFIEGEKSGTIESLKLLHIFLNETWNDENLKKHQNEMINLLIESFEQGNPLGEKLISQILN